MAFIVGAIIGGVAAIGGGLIASNAPKKASQAATQANTDNNALQREVYAQNTQNLSPFMQTGTRAGTSINAVLGLGGDPAAQERAFEQFRNSSGYQFQVDEAERATNSAFAHRGGFNSGAALKALQDRRQQLANGTSGNWLAALQGQQGTGLSAANALAGVGTNFAGAVGANNNALADARGNAALAGASQTNSLLGSLAQTGGYLYGQGAFGSSYKPPAGVGGAINTGWGYGGLAGSGL